MTTRTALALSAALMFLTGSLTAATWGGLSKGPDGAPMSGGPTVLAADLPGWLDPERAGAEVRSECVGSAQPADVCTENVMSLAYPLPTDASTAPVVGNPQWAAMARVCADLGALLNGAQQGCSRWMGTLATTHLSLREQPGVFGGNTFTELAEQGMGRLLVQVESVCSMPGADQMVCMDSVFSALPAPAYRDSSTVDKICQWLPQHASSCRVRVGNLLTNAGMSSQTSASEPMTQTPAAPSTSEPTPATPEARVLAPAPGFDPGHGSGAHLH
jgi:hypothetical protein